MTGPTLGERFERFESLRRGPLREGTFRSRLHGERTAASLGLALGVAFGICFVTGLTSHFIQRGPHFTQAAWPSSPVYLYRVTQGIHVLSGMIAIPLLALKLWTVYPRLWTWPPVRDVAHLLERVSLLALVGGAVFQLSTGLLNIFYWYAFPFAFPYAHYAGAWIAIGGLIVHIGAKWELTRRGLRREPARAEPAEQGMSRAAFLGVAGVAGGSIVLLTAGSAVPALSRLAVLAPRRAGHGPQGVPVNHVASPLVTASARSPDYRLRVDGNVSRPFELTLAELQALPQATERLPISCVEGWSTNATWTGVRVRDLLDRAGADEDAEVVVESLQRFSAFRTSRLNRHHARDSRTLLALGLNGEELHLDHGYPARLIAPNRPGVLQTKWVQRLEVL